jgi:hypothetical protein
MVYLFGVMLTVRNYGPRPMHYSLLLSSQGSNTCCLSYKTYTYLRCSCALSYGMRVIVPYFSQVWLNRPDRPNLVRCTDSHPANQHMDFFYNLLFWNHRPMWCEREILPSDGNYLAECIRQGVLGSLQDLDDVLQQYLDYHIETKTELAMLKDQVG